MELDQRAIYVRSLAEFLKYFFVFSEDLYPSDAFEFVSVPVLSG